MGPDPDRSTHYVDGLNEERVAILNGGREREIDTIISISTLLIKTLVKVLVSQTSGCAEKRPAVYTREHRHCTQHTSNSLERLRAC